tara:strand:+ start:1723 stop:2733 length:1011 start_codon:yes stop_codon:yes gene_type:complete
MSKYLPFICGIEGPEVSESEIQFIKEFNPWGVIIFDRNCKSKNQLTELTSALRTVTHEYLPVLIDQEGGRVSRINYSESTMFKAAKVLGDLLKKNIELGSHALALHSIIMASLLRELGININTIPVLDIPSENESGVIGDRSYSLSKEIVAKAGRIVIESLSTNGVAPVIKHIPGHGRAKIDSHLDLPIIETSVSELDETDFYPFKKNNADLAMAAHIVYKDIDNSQPGTLSKKVINDIIRKKIGFNGLIMTDDISMKAIKISVEDAAVKSLNAGCDLVLHCNGNMKEMISIANSIKNEAILIEIPDNLIKIFKIKSTVQPNELKEELKKILEALE